jgi:Alpha galactosidase C-terminal beta sandwich domain/Alpha galactosidase A
MRVSGDKMSPARVIVTLAAVLLLALGAQPTKALQPNPLHVGMKPVLGWSSWSSFRGNASAAKDEAVARAMVASGLAKLGYRYINQDDGWYECPGGFRPPGGNPVPRGAPAVNQWGLWIPNSRFTARGSTNGIEALADYVHSLGLKFGIYLTPGISAAAVAKNTPVEASAGGRLTGRPSGYTAAQIASTTPEQNYDCGGYDDNHNAGGMVGLNFASPGAQLFVNSWADTLASWGVDFVKLDGIRYPTDVPEIKAWSLALRQTGRPINFDATEGYTVKIAPTLERYATQWEEAEDIECYSCDKGNDHDETFPATDAFPLTVWTDPAETSNFAGPSKVASRFNYAAEWQPYARPGGFNDLDSVEVGNGSHDGISFSARQTVLSLWALASSPLILGSDPRYLTPQDLALLKNRAVLAVDQDGIAAGRVRNALTEQVFAKREPGGDVIVGLFNTNTTSSQEISIGPSAIGLPAGCAAYALENLWSHRISRTSGQITAHVPAEGVALFRVRPRCR